VVYLGAGNHNLRLEFHEVDGVAGVHLWWEQVNAQFLSLGAQDGWVLESSETSGTGGSINASATQFYLGDDSANRQYRSILSFNTSGLPDNAVILSATLKIKSAGVQGTSPFTTQGKLFGDVRLGSFNGSSALQTADFQAPSSRDALLTISSTPSSGWYSGKMISAGLGYINRTGPTQIRLRFALDDNDDRAADYMKFYSGNYGTQAARPVLIIVYYVP
ncbi:MAG TPA: DNRLRE domain-containing protein, partial [Anaerolineales bacterium]